MNSPLPPDLDAALDRIAASIEAGQPESAAAAASAARNRWPREVEPARLHGIALFQLGQIANARRALNEARVIAPQSVEVACNLARVLITEGDATSAIGVLDEMRVREPLHPAILNGLGTAKRAAGDLAGARDAYVRATAAAPAHAGAWMNLAAVELALGEIANAERTTRHALMLAPGHPEGLLLLGHVLAARRHFADAERAYLDGERSAPSDARFAYQAGLMAEEQGHLAQAADAHARALSLAPSLHHALGQLVFLRRQLNEWHGLDSLSSDLRARVAAGAAGIAPFAFLAEPASATEQRRCAQTCADGIEARTATQRAAFPFTHRRRRSDEPLRIGMVANGFGNHPTSLLIVAMIEALRAEPIEIHLFSTAPDDGSPLLNRLRSAVHGWHDASAATAPELAAAIHAANVELLLDLDGYCSGAMPDAFAVRPAPVQINWLAYPGTLGAAWMDYVIADAVVLPPSLHTQFSEQVAWLPRCFQPSDPTRVVAAPPSRAECGLPSSAVVFACFNNRYKIDPASFARMLNVLREVSGSVLWLLGGPDGADRRLHDDAVLQGIDATRIVFMPKMPHPEYLARYALADLFLDTRGYGAHTTASDAIFAGCPVLTVAGATFASRVAASLNQHLGMPQLNAVDDAAFVAMAARIGNDAPLRTRIRAELRDRRSTSGLFDMQAYAHDFAGLLRRMADRHREGLPPALLD